MLPTHRSPDLQAWPDATTCRKEIAAGQLRPSELLDQCQARIERLNGKVNALVRLNHDAARQTAQQADQAASKGATSSLLGLPVSIKDAFATRGLITTASHPPLRDYLPDQDATLVARLKAAGAIIVGKSNLSQLAGDPQCWSPLHGPTRNPWGKGLTPGGSSGGSAVAVALGFSLMDIGSDIGGSIRIPAAYCGITGMKASENRLPRTGHIPHLPGGRRSVRHLLSFGLLARTVADLALGMPCLSGPDALDSEVPPIPWKTTPPPQRPLRIAWWDDFPGLPLCPRTRSALKQTVLRLADAGCKLSRTWPSDFDLEQAWQAFGHIAGYEIGLDESFATKRIMQLGSYLSPKGAPLTRAFCAGFTANPKQYADALAMRDRLMAALEYFLEDYDLLLCPVAALTAYPAFPLSPWRPPPPLAVDGKKIPYIDATLGLTTPFSLTGSPVISLPVGIYANLPVGLQAVGKRWQDEALLAACQQLAEIIGPTPPPPIALNKQQK